MLFVRVRSLILSQIAPFLYYSLHLTSACHHRQGLTLAYKVVGSSGKPDTIRKGTKLVSTGVAIVRTLGFICIGKSVLIFLSSGFRISFTSCALIDVAVFQTARYA